jgi:hypothetical protein
MGILVDLHNAKKKNGMLYSQTPSGNISRLTTCQSPLPEPTDSAEEPKFEKIQKSSEGRCLTGKVILLDRRLGLRKITTVSYLVKTIGFPLFVLLARERLKVTEGSP